MARGVGGVRRVGLLILLSALLLGQGAGGQTTSQKLQQLQQELQQQKQLSAAQAGELNRIRRNIQNLNAQQKEALARLDALAAQVSDLENELAVLNTRTALAERQLADTRSQLGVTTTRVERLKGDVREILNLQYRSRSNDYLGLLSQSRSLSDLLIRLRYANMAGQYNNRIIQNLKGEVATLDEQQAQQARQAQTLKDIGAQRNAALGRLKSRRGEQNTLLASLRDSEQGARALAAQRQADRVLTARTIDGLITQVTAEKVRIEAERQRRLEEERKRREAEALRIRVAQERARQEAIRLAAIRAEQERIAREQAAQRAREAAERARQVAQAQARQQAAAQARAQAAREAQQRAVREQQQRAREQQLQREQAALQQRSQQVQAAQERVAQELRPLPASNGPLGFPLPGGQVSAPYGTGGSPWVVLSASDGSQAVAALEGNVLAVTYYASLGWVVLVDHSSAISAYFGLNEPLVSVGTRVSLGTPLGTVGGSQIIGPQRMAFQYRLGGASVNPGF
ncbi:murein hydrolase activator EnvC family protein [Deinococcus marmoris]|uniref:murein hydrolase activator EnvC family protein n=1 Tax=Deinococcus marmoris TaxID=249408 RepID=UPI001FE0082B|nr:M23 family metallopeptidase [Deinococcus marmoris]